MFRTNMLIFWMVIMKKDSLFKNRERKKATSAINEGLDQKECTL